MIPPYVLYKNPIQKDTLTLVRFLHSSGVENAPPSAIYERGWPDWVTELPSIQTTESGGDQRFVGLAACVRFFETCTGVTDLWQKASSGCDPDYRIGSSS